MPQLDHLDLYRAGIPHAVYDSVRSESAIYYSPGKYPFFAVLTHPEAATVLQDTVSYSSALQGILIEDVSAEMRPVMRAMLPFTDPPAHTELRRRLFPRCSRTNSVDLRHSLRPPVIASWNRRLTNATSISCTALQPRCL